MKDILEQLSVGLVSVTNCCLAEPSLCDLVCDVGSTQDTGADSESILNHVRDQSEAILVDIDTLDERDGLAVLWNLALQLLADACDKLNKVTYHKISQRIRGISVQPDKSEHGPPFSNTR
jgi:hypothetical protein